MAGEVMQGDAAGAGHGHVVQELDLVLGEIVVVGPVERAPQATVQEIELFRFWTIHALCCSVAGMTAAPAAQTLALLDTWAIHNRIHLFLLEALSPEALVGELASGGRDVAHQFGHIHDVRLMWLKAAAPDLLDGLDKFGQAGTPTADALAAALTASGAAISTLLERGFESGRINS